MKFPNMFSPIRIGTVTVPNRFVVPPMGNNFANTDGSLSDQSLGYYQAEKSGLSRLLPGPGQGRLRPHHHRIHRGLSGGQGRPPEALPLLR